MKISFKWKYLFAIVLTVLAIGIFYYGYYLSQINGAQTQRDIFLRNIMLTEESDRLCTFRQQLGYIRECMNNFNNYTKCNDESLQFVYGFSEPLIINVNETQIRWIIRCYDLSNISNSADYILETDINVLQLKANKTANLLNRTS